MRQRPHLRLRARRSPDGRSGCGKPWPPRGFTLVEVVVSVAILSFLFLAVYSAVIASVSTVSLCRENATATQILTEKLETIRLYNWNQVRVSGFVPATFTVPKDPDNTNGPAFFTGTVAIAQAAIPESYSSNLLQVTVEVKWTSGKRPQRRSMTSFIAKNGVQNLINR